MIITISMFDSENQLQSLINRIVTNSPNEKLVSWIGYCCVVYKNDWWIGFILWWELSRFDKFLFASKSLYHHKYGSKLYDFYCVWGDFSCNSQCQRFPNVIVQTKVQIHFHWSMLFFHTVSKLWELKFGFSFSLNEFADVQRVFNQNLLSKCFSSFSRHHQ